MRVVVMRHGPAEGKSATGRDADRLLSAPGRQTVEGVAAALAGLGLRGATVLASPLARAQETARIVGVRLGVAARVVPEMAPGAHWDGVARMLAALDCDDVVVVGHLPDVAEIVVAALDAPGRAAVHFEPGGIACLDCDPHRRQAATLLWHFNPADLAAIAGR